MFSLSIIEAKLIFDVLTLVHKPCVWNWLQALCQDTVMNANIKNDHFLIFNYFDKVELPLNLSRYGRR